MDRIHVGKHFDHEQPCGTPGCGALATHKITMRTSDFVATIFSCDHDLLNPLAAALRAVDKAAIPFRLRLPSGRGLARRLASVKRGRGLDR
jgi:hypothetical protein